MADHNNISFGTDGFRGVISENFTYANVRKITQGLSDFIAYKYMRISDKPSIVVGYDRRFMSEKFAISVAEVLAANGLSVTVSDSVVPTPAISHMTYKKHVIGIMITASHNKHFYNGIKFKEAGRSAPPSFTAELESYVSKASPSAEVDFKPQFKSFNKKYVAYLKSKFKIEDILKKIKGPVVVDFMHGTGAEVLSDIFNSKRVITINSEKDPLFGGIAPEPIEKNMAELIKTVKAKKAALGIAFDGDSDRFAMVDEKGNYLSPCQIAPILLDYLLEKNKLKGKVVQAVSMGYLTKRIVNQFNEKSSAHKLLLEEVPVGFKYIAEKMISEDVAFGVEESGGYSWKGNIPERDGILTGLLMMQILADSKKKMSEVYQDIEKKYGKSYFLRSDFKIQKAVTNKHSFAVKLRKKFPKVILSQKIKKTLTIDGLKIMLANDNWVLMRPSGTEPLLRIYAETGSFKDTKKLIEFAAKMVNAK
ncbi:MAG: phosphoglucomutase/phosphomannomutase family protein [Elusimicrobiales bacterium]|nr:phosphoglucomutase/phosphomannomutase family protein [Elusimicrobiales bacterium]MCK5357788.1 phosphoglucomutase/phosphomannomutase family protein [Elusimicrobiales bacterium]